MIALARTRPRMYLPHPARQPAQLPPRPPRPAPPAPPAR